MKFFNWTMQTQAITRPAMVAMGTRFFFLFSFDSLIPWEPGPEPTFYSTDVDQTLYFRPCHGGYVFVCMRASTWRRVPIGELTLPICSWSSSDFLWTAATKFSRTLTPYLTPSLPRRINRNAQISGLMFVVFWSRFDWADRFFGPHREAYIYICHHQQI